MIDALAFLTFVLAVIAYLQWQTFEKTDLTLKTDQRAWIAPRGAEITRPVERGETLEVEISYENTGKQPAFNVGHNNELGVIDVPLDSRGTAYWENMRLPENKHCAVFEGRHWIGRTAFPGQRYHDVAYIFTDPTGTPDRFLERKITFYVQGCIGYSTLGKPSTTPYCLYLYPVKDVEPTKWPFRFCRTGNETKAPDEH